MSSNIDNQCCPRFEPAPWNEQEIFFSIFSFVSNAESTQYNMEELKKEKKGLFDI